MKLALFKNIEHGTEPSACTEIFDRITGYVRVSDYVAVDFPPLSSDEVIQRQLTALDNAEQRLRMRHEAELDGIREQRAQLLALPHYQAEQA